MAAKVNNVYDASSISILEGLEAVRKRPGMYIGSVSTKGLNHLIYEIADNSVDEHLAGHCDTINVTLNNDGTATITDNGTTSLNIYSSADANNQTLTLNIYDGTSTTPLTSNQYMTAKLS